MIVAIDDLLELAAGDLGDSVPIQVRIDQVQTVLGDSVWTFRLLILGSRECPDAKVNELVGRKKFRSLVTV